MDCARPPAIDIDIVGTKSGNFELKLVLENNDDAEFRADRMRPSKNLLNHFRPRVGCDVVIFRDETAHHVTHTTAGEIGNVTPLA